VLEDNRSRDDDSLHHDAAADGDGPATGEAGVGALARPGVPPVSRLWWAAGPIGLAALATVTVLLVRIVPYVVFVPGSATAVEPLVRIEAGPGGEQPPTDRVGENILFTTVTVERPTGALLLRRTVEDHADITTSEAYFGRQTPEQNRRYDKALMTDAKDKAAKVALEAVGYPVETTEVGAVLLDVDPSYPASAVLVPGDTVTAADDRPVRSADELVDAIGRHRPKEVIRLTLDRLGESEPRTVRAELAENPEEAGRAQLGVSLATQPHFEFPFEVDIDSGDVGGPSAGLAFTLALVDLLSRGDLTGGKRVAVTGTIELDASVGPVGGVAQKAAAAIDAGAEVFLVPPAELDTARQAVGDRLEVVSVSNLDEALAALRRIGGDPVRRFEGG